MSKELTFGDLGEIYDGPHSTPNRGTQGPYFLNIASLNNGRLNIQLSDHVSPYDFELWTKRVVPSEGDLLFSYETRLGEAALMPGGIQACLGRRMALMRPDRDVVIPGFLLYFYLSPAFQATIRARTIHGATVPRIGLKTMSAWKVEIPPVRDQSGIAEVLGALDDKIAANITLARSADDLATANYQFHASAEIRSNLTYGDVATVGGGGTPKTDVEKYWGGPVSWATPTDVTALPAPYLESTARTITEEGLASCSSPLYRAGSILMTSRATIGAFAINSQPTAVNQGFIVVNPHNEKWRWWLFHEMRSRVPEYLSHANGATFLELSRGKFKALPVRLIDEQGMVRFSEVAAALHASSRQALVESDALSNLRDTLLPHLMSGRLCVKDAERQVEAVV